jgi:hypothetical protein
MGVSANHAIEVEASRQKAERAEEWLLKIYKEIPFVQQDSRRRA